MNDAARIALRLIGFALLLAGIAMLVMLVTPGPGEVAEWMGQSCAHGRNEPGEQCNITDVFMVAFSAPLLILVGGVLALAMRKGPLVLDLSRRRQDGPGA